MFDESLIAPSSHLMVFAVMLGVSSFGIWSESKALGRTVSGVVVAMAAAMLMSNLGILPSRAPTYDFVWSILVPIAIPLLLLKANLRMILAETGGMLIAFLLGAIGTICGVLVGFSLLPLGRDAADISGALAASYIGGSLNYAAVGEALQIESDLLAAGAAADNVVIIFFYMTLALMSSAKVLRRWLPSPIIEQSNERLATAETNQRVSSRLNLLHIASSLFISFAICAAGKRVAELLSIERYSILLITALAVAVANLFSEKMAQIEGDFETGLLIMFLFFASIGAGTDLGLLVDSALSIVALVIVIIVIHLVVILLGSRLFKLDLAEVIIASNACASGPTTAAAFAAGKGWTTLITPAIMCGVLGYVMANFVGILVSDVLGVVQ